MATRITMTMPRTAAGSPRRGVTAFPVVAEARERRVDGQFEFQLDDRRSAGFSPEDAASRRPT